MTITGKNDIGSSQYYFELDSGLGYADLSCQQKLHRIKYLSKNELQQQYPVTISPYKAADSFAPKLGGASDRRLLLGHWIN